MGTYCTLFAGVEGSWDKLQELFEEFEEREDYDEEDEFEDGPTCKAGQLLEFGWYDHDWIDYVITDEVLSLDDFFAHEEVQRIADWEIESLEAIKSQCEKQGIRRLNFIWHLGEENLGSLQAGKRAITEDEKFIQFLGYFFPDGRHDSSC